MAKSEQRLSERPLTVDIPGPGADQPAWSKVGVIAVLGFVVGIAWPRLIGFKVGPAVPADLRAQVEAPAHSASAPGSAAGSSSAPAAGSGSAAPGEGEAPSANQEMVVVGQGKILKCYDKRDKKIDDCESLLIDPIVVKRLRELSKCPQAMGLTGKVVVGFEVDFGKKEVSVKHRKKGTTLPTSTVNGILQCAGKDFANVPLDDVPHKHKHYALEYQVSFYGPGKHPEGVAPPADGDDADPAAGKTTNADEASGTAIVAWDTALLRKEPKDGDVVARLVRGTKVKIVGKQGDWYKIESGSKAGWVYRGTIGL